jgi:hypothetical protein
MGAITPSFVMTLESRLRQKVEREYMRMVSADMWYRKVVKIDDSSKSKREILTWLLSTAMIHDMGKDGGNMRFDDLVSAQTEYEHRDAGSGFRVSYNQLTDTDGGGLDLASAWAGDIGAYMAYWPQKKASEFLKTAHLTAANGGFTAYDNIAFFGSSHPYNVSKVSLGTFNNVFTGAASGSYPGACPIDESVTVDVALQNLAKIMGYIATIKMPNGVDPRYLRPTSLLVPPRLYPRAVQLTNAKFIAQAASSGGGSADAEALITALGYMMPTRVEELAGFESDTSFFIGCEQISQSEVGAIIYSNREPFSINWYGPVTQADLSRRRELEWHVHGRNAITAGLPHLLFKGKGS